MNRTRLVAVLTAAVVLNLAIACGSGGSPSTPSPSPSPSPSPTPSPAPTPAPATATVTITSGGVNPKQVEIAQGGRVTFVNNDLRNHEMNSNPHPEHTDCPEMNAVGFLTPGQSRQTGNLNTTRTCGYHDHNEPSTQSLMGTIAIR